MSVVFDFWSSQLIFHCFKLIRTLHTLFFSFKKNLVQIAPPPPKKKKKEEEEVEDHHKKNYHAQHVNLLIKYYTTI